MLSTGIDLTDIRRCSHGLVSSDPPELATSPEFRADMVRARKAKHWTQKQLGARVGTSQNIISLIESGEITSSGYVLPICKALGIAPPQFHENEEQKHWSQLGHLLSAKSPKQFRRALALVESMLEDAGESEAAGPSGNGTPVRK
jgi:transcriptional regulator with XRE-family HTH domain